MQTVLVVDDDPITLEFVRAALRGVGLRVEFAASAGLALELMARSPFAAVLLEVLLPEKEGVETIVEMQRKWPEQPIVAMSGGGNYVSAREALTLATAVGARTALPKPFSAIELLKALDEVLTGEVAEQAPERRQNSADR